MDTRCSVRWFVVTVALGVLVGGCGAGGGEETAVTITRADAADAGLADGVGETGGDGGQGPGRIVFTGMDFEEATWEVRVTGQLGETGLESDDQLGETTASGQVAEPNERDIVVYTGEIETLDHTGPVRVEVDGEIRAGGPEVRSSDEGRTPPIEMTIHSSVELLRRNGRTTERMIALYAAKAFEDAGYAYEIVHNLRAQRPPNETSVCKEEGASNWWGSRVGSGDVRTLRKDVNILTLDSNGGGCGAIAGRWGTTPGRNIDEEREWTATGKDDWHRNMHGTLHEIGHEIGARHDHDKDQPGKQHWGRGWNEDLGSGNGVWHRTPNVAGNGAPNQCGSEIEKREYEQVVRHQTYNDCAVGQFVVADS
ncbi:MAG: M12 family metallo-peptidase [Bradymonadaceae bacterium]